jgi:hypothetical protein
MMYDKVDPYDAKTREQIEALARRVERRSRERADQIHRLQVTLKHSVSAMLDTRRFEAAAADTLLPVFDLRDIDPDAVIADSQLLEPYLSPGRGGVLWNSPTLAVTLRPLRRDYPPTKADDADADVWFHSIVLKRPWPNAAAIRDGFGISDDCYLSKDRVRDLLALMTPVPPRHISERGAV